MSLPIIILIIVLLVAFGGGGFYAGGNYGPYYGGGVGIVGLLVIILVVYFFLGEDNGRPEIVSAIICRRLIGQLTTSPDVKDHQSTMRPRENFGGFGLRRWKFLEFPAKHTVMPNRHSRIARPGRQCSNIHSLELATIDVFSFPIESWPI